MYLDKLYEFQTFIWYSSKILYVLEIAFYIYDQSMSAINIVSIPKSKSLDSGFEL